jgi:hypothetical protein
LSISIEVIFGIEITSIILLVILVMFHIFGFACKAAHSAAATVAKANAAVQSTCNWKKSCPDHDD